MWSSHKCFWPWAISGAGRSAEVAGDRLCRPPHVPEPPAQGKEAWAALGFCSQHQKGEVCTRNSRSFWLWSPGLHLCGQAGPGEAQGCCVRHPSNGASLTPSLEGQGRLFLLGARAGEQRWPQQISEWICCSCTGAHRS